MNRKLAKELKTAGFRTRFYQVGRRFYPSETNAEWSESERENGVTITPYELQTRLQDIDDGYYCPNLADLVEACGHHLSRLHIEKTTWTAQCNDPAKFAISNTPEEAVAKLWLSLPKNKS